MESAGRILVIDDEWSIRDVMETILVGEGFAVDCAEDGAAGLRMLGEADYDLVITDLNMPQIDGIEVLRRIQEMGLGTVGIVATGYGSDQATMDALKAGAFGYITKPFRLDEIRILIHKAREFQSVRKENAELRRRLANAACAPIPDFADGGVDLNQMIQDYERIVIDAAMARTKGVKSRAAELLGIKRTTLVEKLRKRAPEEERADA